MFCAALGQGGELVGATLADLMRSGGGRKSGLGEGGGQDFGGESGKGRDGGDFGDQIYNGILNANLLFELTSDSADTSCTHHAADI